MIAISSRWLPAIVALACAGLPVCGQAQLLLAASDAPVGTPPAAAASSATATPAGDDEFVDEYASAVPQVRDPLERINRTMFKFNNSVYDRVLTPLAHGYENVVPRLARRGIRSFFDNVHFPVRLLACVMEGKIDRAASETGKFVVNSTVGLAGFIRVSDRFPALRVPEEDLGQAFGKWGFGHGPFLVLPVLGPSSVRDGIGSLCDYYATPTRWHFMQSYDWEVRWGVPTIDTLSSLPEILGTYNSLRKAAVDPYIAFRNGYIQYRDGQLKE